MAKDYGDDGRWVTINGRRVFIAEGQSLGDAMKKSGKFGKVSKVKGSRKNEDEKNQKRLLDLEMHKYTSKEKLERAKEKLESGKLTDYEKKYYENYIEKREGKSIGKILENSIKKETPIKKNFPSNMSREIYEMDVDKGNAWSGNAPTKNANGDKVMFVSKNGKSENTAEDIVREMQSKHPELNARISDNGNEIMFTLKKGDETSKNSYTRDELKAKYGTDNTDIINAGKESKDRVKLNEKQISEGNRLNEKSKSMAKEDIQTYLGGNKSNWDNDGDFIRDLADNYNLDLDDAKKMFDDANKNNGSSNWREQVKANNEQMEKDIADIQNKINEYRTRSANAKDGLESYQLLKEADRLQDKYYERFRENERANAKLKQEQPNEKYEYVDSYATYKDKFNDAFGEDGSGDDYVSAKMYTNDEFMEHLTDSNWHSERKQLEQANLTNQELSYIKDHTKVGAWSVGEELTGKANVEKMIQEAKTHSSSKSINDSIRNKSSKTKADRNIDAFDDTRDFDQKEYDRRWKGKEINYNTPGKIGNMDVKDYANQRKEYLGKVDKLYKNENYEGKYKKLSDKTKSGEMTKKQFYNARAKLVDAMQKKQNQISKNYNDEVVSNNIKRYNQESPVIKNAIKRMSESSRAKTQKARERLRNELSPKATERYGNSVKGRTQELRMFNAWKEYNQKHPNSQMTLETFKKKYKG